MQELPQRHASLQPEHPAACNWPLAHLSPGLVLAPRKATPSPCRKQHPAVSGKHCLHCPLVYTTSLNCYIGFANIPQSRSATGQANRSCFAAYAAESAPWPSVTVLLEQLTRCTFDSRNATDPKPSLFAAPSVSWSEPQSTTESLRVEQQVLVSHRGWSNEPAVLGASPSGRLRHFRSRAWCANFPASILDEEGDDGLLPSTGREEDQSCCCLCMIGCDFSCLPCRL